MDIHIAIPFGLSLTPGLVALFAVLTMAAFGVVVWRGKIGNWLDDRDVDLRLQVRRSKRAPKVRKKRG